MRFNRRRRATIAGTLALSTMALGGCGLFGDDSRVVPRSDAPMVGYEASMLYSINASPNGDGETNQIVTRGVNNTSPMPLLSTVFGRGVNSRTQVAQISGNDGSAINVLSMNKWGINVGLTEYLDSQVATYEQRDALGNRVCGAKVRMDFKPNIAQVVKSDKYRRAWDALFYYSIPCGDTAVPSTDGKTIVKPKIVLDLTKAKFMALVIDQQFTPRVTGKPILFNRGHSVTIVGGRASRYIGGWWQSPLGLLNASNMVIDMVKDLDQHEWLSFGNADNGGLVYSAGDADVYLSLKRIFLNRQSPYLVNFRSDLSEQWKRVLVNPVYNFEWNDLKQNYKALMGGKDMPDIDEMVDQNTGLPKDIDKPDSDDSKALKEIETAGCQNCPNPTLEQIQFIDATNGSADGEPMYAMTIRGWIGSQSSMVMFGKVPGKVSSYTDAAEAHRKQLGMTDCPVQRNEKGEKLDDDKQYSAKDCATWLREGAMWDLLTKDASKFGFDVVGQFRVRDNSSWASNCTGSGESTSCNLVATNRRLDASYMFTDTEDKMQKAWTVMQLLGEVGMRTLGMSYASGQYDGSGLDFAMAQSQVYNAYYTDNSKNTYNPELLFALDARALQLPQTLGKAGQILYGR